jgi:hypothetical protein
MPFLAPACVQSDSLPGVAPPPLGQRALFALAAAFLMGIFVMIAWSFIGFGFAASMRGTKSETVGYGTIVIAPAGALLAAVSAFVTGLPAYGERWWLRWVVLPVVFLIGGVVFFALLAR